MAIKARELRFAVDLVADGAFLDEDGVALDVPPEWTPEHLLLAALVRCSLASFTYHAERAGLAVDDVSGSARALVTAKAERDCFVGASLTVKPSYRWTVNGRT